MEQQPWGQSFRKLMTAAVNLIVTVKKTEDILVSRQEILQVVSVLNTFKPLVINWEDFREQNLDYFVIDRPPVLLLNQIKAHISYLGKLESQFNRLRALYRPELLTDCGDQQTC